MSEMRVIGKREVICLLVNAIGARIFLNFPRPSVDSSGTAAWIEIVFCSILVLFLFTIIQKLFANFEGMDVIDVSEYIGGTVVRVIYGFTTISLLVLVAMTILREFSENMKTVSLETSPLSFVMMIFLAFAVICCYIGLDSLLHLHSLATPVVFIIFLFLIVALMPKNDFDNFYPLLGNGAKSIATSGVIRVSIFGPMLYLFLLRPYMGGHKYFVKAGYLSIAFAAFHFIIACITYQGIISYPASTQYFMPMYQLARHINYGRFFQRIETFFVIAWAISGLLYLSVVFYFLTYSFKKTFKLSYHRPLILPTAVLIFSLAFLPSNLMSAINLETKVYVKITWIIVFILPIVVLTIATIKKRLQEGATKNE